MKKFIASSPKFVGEVHILYNDDNRLAQIDFLPADLNDDQVAYFKRTMPVILDMAFMKGFPSSELVFIEEGFVITFEMFYDKYGKKINVDRCKTIWKRLGKSDHVKAYFGIAKYDRHLKACPWKNKQDPQTYLTNKAWNNEWQ